MKTVVNEYMYDRGWNAAIEAIARMLHLRAEHQVSEDLQILAHDVSGMARPSRVLGD